MTHSCVTGYPAHRHTSTFTHWRPMCSFTASYRDIDTHSYSLPLCFTHVNKTWHLWILKACPICMLIHLLLSMTCLTRPNTSPVCNRMHVWQSYSDLKMNYSQLTSALQGTAAHKVCQRARVCVLCMCALWCLCGWLSAPLHLSLCSPIHYPQHLAAKACKEDISLGKCFLKAVTQGTANHRSHTSSNLHSY